MQYNYKRLVFVTHYDSDREKYHGLTLAEAEFCQRWGMRYEEIVGSGEFIGDLARAAGDLNRAGADFLVIPPGETLRQGQFLRALQRFSGA